MSYQGVVNIIRGVAQAVNPTGFFEHGRTWDASLNFNEGDPQIYLYPLTNTVDESNNYFETWQVVMGFFFQDTQDSTPAEREDIIANADDLLRSFIATISQVEGIAIAGVRAEPRYRQMAGTYSGMLLNFTLGATSNVCDEEAPPDIPNVPTFCEKVETCLGITSTGDTTKYLNEQGQWTTPADGGGSFENGNGLTFDTDHYDLGGEITDDTTLSFDPTEFKLIIGDVGTPSILAFGNLNNDSEARFIVTGVGAATISANSVDIANVDATGSVAISSADVIEIEADGDMLLQSVGALNVKSSTEVVLNSDDTTALYMYPDRLSFSVNKPVTPVAGDIYGIIGHDADGNQSFITNKENEWSAGYFNFIQAGEPKAQLFYGLLDSNNATVDVVRIEANPNEAHGRYIVDTNTGEYNGWHVNETYVQLEFGKTAEDGQATGITLTVNSSGVHHYESGFIVNSFDNFGNFSIGDPADDDTWRFYRDNDSNLLVQVKVSGTWTTINQFNKP